jgi:hypothetical protein
VQKPVPPTKNQGYCRKRMNNFRAAFECLIKFPRFIIIYSYVIIALNT